MLYIYQVMLGVVAVAYIFLVPLFGGTLMVAIWVFSIVVIATTQSYYLRVMDGRQLRAGALADFLPGEESSKAI